MRRYIDTARRVIVRNLMPIVSPNYRLNYRDQGLINFIDVGSVGGLPDPWRQNANVVRFLLNFEPNESPKSGRNFITYNTGVWAIEQTRPFYIYKGFRASGSSLHKQNIEYVRANYETLRKRGPKHLAETWFERSQLVDVIELKCRPIDRILSDEFPATPFHFMKVDAQGAESSILKGAETLLSSSCIGLHLELFTIPLYEGIVLLEDVEAYLLGFGFRLARKFPAHGTFDSQHDCLFLKEKADPVLLSIIDTIYDLSE